MENPGLAHSDLRSDLEDVRARVGPLWEKLRGKRILITGGTGFFGSWLLETLIDADHALDLGVQAVVLTRDPKSFEARLPHLARAKPVQLHTGDVRDFDRPSGRFTHVIHAATETSKYTATSPENTLDTVIQGTRRVLEQTREDKLESFLYISSGAVYGTQPPTLEKMPEDFAQGPLTTDLGATYGHAKRVAEHLCALAARDRGLPLKIARCFALIGPYMPFDSHFAAGAFIRNALAGESIQIEGDGTALRSYLYASDLAVWLWTLLLKARNGAIYNVGSDQAVSIRDLAKITQTVLHPEGSIAIAKTPVPGNAAARYIPNTDRARTELGLTVTVPLEEAIRRTGRWRKRQLEKGKP